eukprot:6339081-Prorocentrum_lima.AAC.1
MTSSLVGSEMCIRDSLSSLIDSSPFMGPKLGRCVPRSSSCGWVHCAVSYTHLTLPTICSV